MNSILLFSFDRTGTDGHRHTRKSTVQDTFGQQGYV